MWFFLSAVKSIRKLLQGFGAATGIRFCSVRSVISNPLKKSPLKIPLKRLLKWFKLIFNKWVVGGNGRWQINETLHNNDSLLIIHSDSEWLHRYNGKCIMGVQSLYGAQRDQVCHAQVLLVISYWLVQLVSGFDVVCKGLMRTFFVLSLLCWRCEPLKKNV